jgi:hypothetical protein
MPDEEPRRTTGVLQPGLVHVEVHPVDALDLEAHMTGQDIGNSAR